MASFLRIAWWMWVLSAKVIPEPPCVMISGPISGHFWASNPNVTSFVVILEASATKGEKILQKHIFLLLAWACVVSTWLFPQIDCNIYWDYWVAGKREEVTQPSKHNYTEQSCTLLMFIILPWPSQIIHSQNKSHTTHQPITFLSELGHWA